MLMRYEQGERHVWQVVKVPSVEAEAQRHLHWDLETLKQERASTMPRIEGLLSSQGSGCRARRSSPSNSRRYGCGMDRQCHRVCVVGC